MSLTQGLTGPASLVVNGTAVNVSGTFATTGQQQYLAPVSVVGDTVFNTSAANLSFAGDLLATSIVQNVTVETSGTASFGGVVGNGSPQPFTYFSAFTVGSGKAQLAGNVAALSQTYNAELALLNDVTFAGLSGAFNGGVDAQNNSVQLVFTSVGVDGANWTNLQSLNFEGGTLQAQNTIQTTGVQEYNGSVVLAGDTAFVAGAEGVSFLGNVEGNAAGGQNLSVTTPGAANFTAGAGAGVSLRSINLATVGASELNGSFVTSSAQTYGNVGLTDDVTLQAGLLGPITLQGTVDGNAALTINTAAASTLQGPVGSVTPLRSVTSDGVGSLTLGGNVTTSGNQTYGEALNLSDSAVLTGDAGSLPLGVTGNGNDLFLNFTSGVALRNLTGLDDLRVDGEASIEGLIATTGSQTYSGNVTLSDATVIEANVATVDESIIGNNNDLTLNTATTVTIDANATMANLANLTVIGAAELDASISTSGVQNFAGPVTLLGSTDLTGSAGIFTGGVAGNSKALSLNYTGTTTIDGSAVFGNIGDFTVVGPVNLNGAISTTGFQSYGTAALFGDTSLTSTTASKNVSFTGTVDGNAALAISSTSGRIQFFGAVGAGTPLQAVNLTGYVGVDALSTLAIDGTGGNSHGLVLQGSGAVNMSQPGSTIRNANLSGIHVRSSFDFSRLGGFTITDSGEHGIDVESGLARSGVIENNTITGSGGDGIRTSGAIGLDIQGNRVAGGAKAGIRVVNGGNFKGDTFSISNNTIGLGANGKVALPNAGQGLLISGGFGVSAVDNLIGGNDQYGIVVTNGASDVSLRNNSIGIGTDLSTPVPNGQSGIFVLGNATGTVIASNTIRNNSGMAGIQVVDGSTNTMIGGATAGEANLIASSGEFGITVSGVVTGTQVLRNLVSGSTTANIYLNNAQGLSLGDASGGGNEIDAADHGIIAGGDLTGTTIAGNTISTHSITGVLLAGAQNVTVEQNTIKDNTAYGLFGTGDLAGSQVKSNTLSEQQVGVYVYEGSNLTIGASDGTAVPATEGNLISNNSFAGVILDGGTDANGSLTSNVSVLSNSMYNNSQFGIALVNGANDGILRPSLSSATTEEVTGSISGLDGEVYRIQYFKSSANVTTSSRFAQAETLLSYQDVTINGTTASIDLNVASLGVNTTDWITVSKTLMDGSTPKTTSELSYGVRVVE